MNVAVANGFPPETYLPMLAPMLTDYRAVSLLPRALWADEPVPDTLGTWKSDLTADLLAGLAEHQLEGVVGVGHSFGGVASMLAALDAPHRFSALVLLDPTILSHEWLAMLKASRERGTIGEDFPLAARAAKRQQRFASRDEAYAYFRPRGVFADWHEAALREYIAHGLVDDGDGVRLAWPPAWEAYYFKTGYTEIWDALPAFNGLLPTLIVRGGTSDTYTAAVAAAVREILPSATHVEVEGHGHLFPHSAPEQTAAIVAEWLRSVRRR